MTSGGSRKDSRRELILGCLTLALASGYYLLALRIPESGIADVVGPQGLPKSYAALLAFLSLILIGRSLPAQRAAPLPRDAEAKPKAGGVSGRMLGMLLIGALYIVLVPWLGYILSITGLIIATVYCQGGGLNRASVAVAIGGALCLWLLFVRLLHIGHPPGIWPSLL